MPDLSVNYLGYKLKNPIVISSSGLTSTVESIIECVNAGAGAVVVKSIFEEQIMRETKELESQYQSNYHTEAAEYINRMSFEHSLNEYLQLIKDAKQKAGVPIIGSINAAKFAGWTKFAKRIADAGADAVELNIFIVPDSTDITAQDIEKTYIDIVKDVKKEVNIPVAVKIGPFFTNTGNIVKKLSSAGVDSVVLFNRFQTVSVNEEDLKDTRLKEGRWLSLPEDRDLPKRWIASLYGDVKCDLSATSGIRNGNDIIELIQSGASIVQVASVLYLNGIDYIGKLKSEINNRVEELGHSAIAELKGINSYALNREIVKSDRLQYFRAISALNTLRHKGQ